MIHLQLARIAALKARRLAEAQTRRFREAHILLTLVAETPHREGFIEPRLRRRFSRA